MIFDCHSHTEFSSDSKMKAEEALEAARKKGIGLVFTEHYDYDYINCKNTSKDMIFRFDANEYWSAYENLRGKDLNLGVEVSLTDNSIEKNLDFIAKAPFDEVIGSIHFMENYDLYYGDFYEGKSQKEAYHLYLEMMAEQIAKNSYIDVLGHIDYICRYSPYDNQNISYAEFVEDIDKVLKAALENDVIMELNTRRLGDRMALKELVPLYKRYADFGGKYVTLGSDAHTKENIAMNFKVAAEMAQELGLQIVSFRDRKIIKA